MDYAASVRILKNVPLTPSYSDILTFATPATQANYFMGKTVKQFNSLMYIKNQPIVLPDAAASYRVCNYLMFTNPDDSNKWYYGFILSVEYLADGTTAVTYQIDPIQTFWFSFNVRQCFVEREHVSDDVVGNHIKDEGLALGYYKVNSFQTQLFFDWWLIVVSSVNLSDGGTFAPSKGSRYNDVYSGLYYYCYAPDDFEGTLSDALEGLAEVGKSDAIVAMYMVPFALIPDGQVSTRQLKEVATIYQNTVVAPNTGTLSGYAPRNKKLLTYPYRGLRLSNRSGQSIVLRYELFTGNPTLSVTGSLFPNGRILLIPLAYDGRSNNIDSSINIGEYPQCAWLKDVYSNWLATQNVRWGYDEERRELNAKYGIARSLGGTAVNAVAGNWEGVGSGIGETINTIVGGIQDAQLAATSMAEEKQVHSMLPPGVRGQVGNESTLQLISEYGFQIEEITITEEYAKSIDSYFDMFGYRVDVVKTPNISTRQSWNYVKTIGAVVRGDVPAEASTLFQMLLNRGVRFWHNEDVGNYSLNNGVIS